MKFKNLDLFRLTSYLSVLGLLLFIGFSSNAVQAQDFPLSLKRTTDLSPRNVQEFQQLAAMYKKAVCFPHNYPTGQQQRRQQQQQQQQQQLVDSCTPNQAMAIQARNALIYATISQIDLNFTKYQRSSRRRKVIFETLMDFLVIAGDTASIITNGVRPKNIINAGSALVQLSRESVDKNLRLQETQALFNQMEANRLKVLGDILPKIAGADKLGIDDYPFEAAWIDIVDYYRAGTWDNALSDIAANAAQEKDFQEKRVQGIKSFSPATEEEATFSESSLRALMKFEKALGVKETKDATSEKLRNLVKKLEEDEKLKKILESNKLSSSTPVEQILDKLIDIRDLLQDAQNLEALNKINRAITEAGIGN
ncbi:MAG TPA: hypothetical protein VGB00_16470 [Pyrinomonadaceae bacterium]|jgi:hypothetical protein